MRIGLMLAGPHPIAAERDEQTLPRAKKIVASLILWSYDTRHQTHVDPQGIL